MDRPLFAFAGIWTMFNGDRGTKSKPVPGPHQVYGFLTTSPNAVVEPIPSEGHAGDPDHRRRAGRVDACTVDEAKALQWPLPDDALQDRDARRRQGRQGSGMTTLGYVIVPVRRAVAPLVLVQVANQAARRPKRNSTFSKQQFRSMSEAGTTIPITLKSKFRLSSAITSAPQKFSGS